MKQIAEQLQRLHIGIEVSGSLNETNDLSVKARELVEDVRLGQDIGCVIGLTKNCTNPIAERTGTQKIGNLINDLTVRQIAAALGADYDPLTKEEITPNEAQMAKLTLLSLGLTERVSGVTRLTDDALIQHEKKYGQDFIKVLSKKEAEIARKKQVIENNFNSENVGYSDAAVRNFQPGKTHRAENINAGQVTDRDGLLRIDSQKSANDSQVAKNLGLENVKSLNRLQTQLPAWKTGTLVSDHVLTELRKFTMIPSLKTKCVIVMDMSEDKAKHCFARVQGESCARVTSFQKRVQKLLNRHGHRLLFLPPYSPDLNPIEKKWA